MDVKGGNLPGVTVLYDWSTGSRSYLKATQMLSNKQEIFKKLSFGVKLRPKPKIVEEKLTLQVLPEDVKKDLRELKNQLSALEDDSTKKKKVQKPKIQKDIVIIANKKGAEDTTVDEVDEKGFLQQKYEKKLAQLRRLNRIYHWGVDIPDPILEFSDVKNLPEGTVGLLEKIGINDPSPVQMQAVPLMLQRRDILCCAPTGSGKTLAFVLPILIDCLQYKKNQKKASDALLAIVLEPTRELASQTYKQFVKFGSTADVTYASFDSEEIPQNVNVLVTTPNRLVHSFDKADLSHLRWLVVDESDRLFEVEEGEARCFRTQLAMIYKTCHGGNCVNAFFSATYSGQVENWFKENIPNFASICIGNRNSSNTSVEQKLVYAGSEHGKIVALRDILLNKFTPSALIFVQSKLRCRELLKALSNISDIVPIGAISSEKTLEEREKVINEFRAGDILVLICTDIMGRGLDFKNVSMVINFDLPPSAINYIHRIGRTGRAGNKGESITFFTDIDRVNLQPIVNVITQAGFEVPEYTLKIHRLNKEKKNKLKKHPLKRHRLAFLPLSKYKKHKINKERSELKKKNSVVPGTEDPIKVPKSVKKSVKRGAEAPTKVPKSVKKSVVPGTEDPIKVPKSVKKSVKQGTDAPTKVPKSVKKSVVPGTEDPIKVPKSVKKSVKRGTEAPTKVPKSVKKSRKSD